MKSETTTKPAAEVVYRGEEDGKYYKRKRSVFVRGR